MWSAIKGFLGSKKGTAAIVAILVWVGGLVGFNIDPSLLLPPVGVLIAYILGQGAADIGKSKALVEADTVREVRAGNEAILKAAAPDPT